MQKGNSNFEKKLESNILPLKKPLGTLHALFWGLFLIVERNKNDNAQSNQGQSAQRSIPERRGPWLVEGHGMIDGQYQWLRKKISFGSQPQINFIIIQMRTGYERAMGNENPYPMPLSSTLRLSGAHRYPSPSPSPAIGGLARKASSSPYPHSSQLKHGELGERSNTMASELEYYMKEGWNDVACQLPHVIWLDNKIKWWKTLILQVEFFLIFFDLLFWNL